jgi:hypothetical protein
MSRTMSFYDLRDALAQPDCAVCRLAAKAGDQYLRDLVWENVNDPEVRHNIRQARGLCHEHAWALAEHRASLGATIIMHDVLQDVLQTMEGARFQTLPILSLRRTQEALDPKQPAAATAEAVAQLVPQQRCPVCVSVETMEKIYLSDLVENLLGEEGLMTEFQSSDGLCLSHFRGALAYVRDAETFEALLGAQRAIWERLVDHLSKIIRKSDHRFRDEEPGEERGASLRAVAALSGAQQDKDRKKKN